jgi:hypothetical protein
VLKLVGVRSKKRFGTKEFLFVFIFKEFLFYFFISSPLNNSLYSEFLFESNFQVYGFIVATSILSNRSLVSSAKEQDLCTIGIKNSSNVELDVY